MPLRDHFHPPLDRIRSWAEFHGQWPAMIVLALGRKLPKRYFAGPNVNVGSSIEIDVASFEDDDFESFALETDNGNAGGVATAVWAPAKPTLAVVTDLPSPDDYEVLVYDSKYGRQLVAAVEIVSPANKDRPDHRAAFVAKCAALLQNRVSVCIVDLVTTRHFNLYHDLLELIGQSDPSLGPEPTAIYAVACRGTKKGQDWLLETWNQPLTVGEPLPTLPLWLADNLAVPLELETSYEDTCRALRIR
jgi:hypothetical protein